MIYIKRRTARKIREIIDFLPVVVVAGARQVGKSTMLQHEFEGYRYLTFDDYDLLARARTDPSSLWVDSNYIIIDEAQKLPSIFPAIKLAVDHSDRRKRFIVSGSANLYLMEKVTESLAGRAAYHDLLPFSVGEVQGAISPSNFNSLWEEECHPSPMEPPKADLIETMLRGFMPPVLELETQKQVITWMDGYVRMYLERDLRQLSQVESLIDFRKVMQCVALRTGSILNQADVAKDCGLSHATTHRYIRLLEVSHIISRVPAYSASRSKRLVKTPKLFFLDPALAVFLAGHTGADSLKISRELGGCFETLIYLHLRSLSSLMTPPATIHYWRTSTNCEVDFVIEHGRHALPVEAKLTRTPRFADAESLLAFLEVHPQASRGVLVHAGSEITWLHSKVIAVPWWWLDM